MQQLKYVGVPIFLNGKNYYIPGLSFRDFRSSYELLTADLPAEGGAPLMDAFEARIPIIAKAVQRNYPEVTEDDLREWLDMNTFALTIKAIAGQSGIKPVSEGE